MTEINPTTTTIVLPAGDVEYSLANAAVSIDELIDLLTEAKENEGAEFVAFSSGNYRGAQWVRPGLQWDWADS